MRFNVDWVASQVAKNMKECLYKHMNVYADSNFKSSGICEVWVEIRVCFIADYASESDYNNLVEDLMKNPIIIDAFHTMTKMTHAYNTGDAWGYNEWRDVV